MAELGRLKKWTDEMRDEFNILRARSHKIKASMQKIHDKYEDCHEYNYNTVFAYCQSDTGKKDYERALKIVREEAKNKTFAQRGSRVDTLIEMAEKLLFHFRLTEKTSEMTRLAAELRSTLGEIRSEVDPYGLEDSATRSHFDRLLSGFSKLDEKKQDLILEDQGWISTTPTQSN